MPQTPDEIRTTVRTLMKLFAKAKALWARLRGRG